MSDHKWNSLGISVLVWYPKYHIIGDILGDLGDVLGSMIPSNALVVEEDIL